MKIKKFWTAPRAAFLLCLLDSIHIVLTTDVRWKIVAFSVCAVVWAMYFVTWEERGR